jgi:DNA polymerase II large subunit
MIESLGIEGWSWLREIKPPVAEADEAREFMFMEDVLGGRPIFSFPQVQGGFRLRYGRARNTGLAAVGIHPSAMIILRKFIAIGTQLRLEKPGKAGIAAAVDSIEPPVVRLTDGSVLKLPDPREAEKLLESNTVEKVLFLGDILIGYGEFLENNRPLLPSGFVEEWWRELLCCEITKNPEGIGEFSKRVHINAEEIAHFLSGGTVPTVESAVALSKGSDLPLHPAYTFFWENVRPEELDYLRTKLSDSSFAEASQTRIRAKYDEKIKQILENLCLPHKVDDGGIIIEKEAQVLHELLGLASGRASAQGNDVFEKIFNISGLHVLRKGPVYVGARMGRPEKAKPREMRPMVHCLYPIGLAGGPRRSIIEAASNHSLISIDIVHRKCHSCGQVTYTTLCNKCGKTTDLTPVCPKCGLEAEGSTCPACKGPTELFTRRSIPIRDHLNAAERKLSLTVAPDVKGVRGLTNATRTPEHIEKGLLRAKHDVSVFKDGTIRFDATNAPLTQFNPAEIGVDVARLRELGYEQDIQANPLESDSQCLNLKVHDIIVPKQCGDYFVRVAKFLDELLQTFYGLPPFYKIQNKQDLLGHLVVGLSPHTSVGVIGRIVGFTSANVCFAHPFWHATKRRDCDGDEDSISLALDILLNFSKRFLPSRIGGIMDAPILLTVSIKPTEIARQAYNLETVEQLPLRFYQETQKRSDPKPLTAIIETVNARLSSTMVLDSLGCTHQVSNINSGNLESAYKKLGSMLDKVTEQLKVAEQVKAVEVAEVARRVLSTHFMRDLIGNLKAFGAQRFRCSKCNTKFRRIPLKGSCLRCGGKLSLTVYKGSVEKYLKVAKNLVNKYKLGEYHTQRLLLLQQEIDSLFTESEEKKQPSLAQFV